jgi:hypothetical protein
MQNVMTFLSTTTEGRGFCVTAAEVYATRAKEEEMVQELLNVKRYAQAEGVSAPEIRSRFGVGVRSFS